MTLAVRPCELDDANAFIGALHRHHKPVQGHRFSLSCWDDDRLCGVAVVGRPVAGNKIPNGNFEVVEVTRLCTDGTRNACSALYGACARVAREMGFARIQTYILESELGTSLRASGWVYDGPSSGTPWASKGRPNRSDKEGSVKQRWRRDFRTLEGERIWPTQPESPQIAMTL